MDLELRPIEGDEEFAAFGKTLEGAFGIHLTDQDREDVRLIFEQDRSLAVLDGGAIVGTAGAYSFDMTLPGGTTTPTVGVTAVGVRQTHRRRGLLTALMSRQLDDVAARGEAVAVLTASESVIYGRFGYGLANQNMWWQVKTEGTRLARPPACGGRLRLLDAEEAGKALPAVYERARLRHPGQLSRSSSWWERWMFDRESWRHGSSARFYVVHESDTGELDGYLAYRMKEGDWDHGIADSTLTVAEQLALDDEVEAALWQYAIEVDLVAVVRGWARPVDEPLRWRLADPRRLSTTEVVDHLWVRILDVATALGARRYGTSERLVLDVVDRFRPATSGRYVVEGDEDGATASAAGHGEAVDLSLGIEELGAIYLGGVAPSLLAKAGRVAEERPGALARADAFFAANPRPWCCTDF